MDQDTKRAAVDLLAANRQAVETLEDKARQLRRARVSLITAARQNGMEWDEIAAIVGHADGHAMRMWYRRSGGEA